MQPEVMARSMRSTWRPDGVMVLPFAHGRLNKSQTIDTVRQASPWTRYDLAEPATLKFADGCVALIYTAVALREDRLPYHAHITSLYRFRDGIWQLVLHQQTPIAAE
jgi:hypothetical protein